MKIRHLALATGLIAAHGAANAWFFFFLPIGAIQGAIEGQHCVAAHVKVGDVITTQGRQWNVKSTSGVSSRCNNTPQWPVIAKLEPILTPSEIASEQTICMGQGVSVGSRTTVPLLGEVEVRSLGSASECSDTRTPVAARVVRVAGLQSPRPVPQASPQPVAEPTPQTTPQPVSFTNTPFPPQYKTSTVPEAKSVTDRLRELKQLRDENLITQDVYEAKQRDILQAQ
jgi:hypothetical protein